MTTNLLSLYLPQGIWAYLFMGDFSTPTFRKGKYQRFCQVNYSLRRRVHKKNASWFAHSWPKLDEI